MSLIKNTAQGIRILTIPQESQFGVSATTSVAGTLTQADMTAAVGAFGPLIWEDGGNHDIASIIWNTSTTSGTPTSFSFEVSIQTTGLAQAAPTGTKLGTLTTTSVPASASVITTTFASPTAVIDYGTVISIIFEVVSTPTGNYSIALASSMGNFSGFIGSSYTGTRTGGVWTPSTSLIARARVISSDGTVGYIGYTASPVSVAATAWNNTTADATTNRERGIAITMPLALKSVGMYFVGNASVAGATFDIKLYDSDGTTVLKTYSVNPLIMRTVNSTTIHHFFWPVLSHTANTKQYLVIVPTSASNIVLVEHTISATLNNKVWSWGAQVTGATKTAAGVWTETDTFQPVMGLIVSDFDTGAVSGGAGNLAMRLSL